MHKKEPDFIVSSKNAEQERTSTNINTAIPFAKNLVDVFQDGVCHTLEAKRLINSNTINKDLDLIMNDEQHTRKYDLMNKIFADDVSADDIIDD